MLAKIFLPAIVSAFLPAIVGALRAPRILVVGGTGRIGSAVATHLLLRRPEAHVVLAGRDERRGRRAVEEVQSEANKAPEFRKLDYRADLDVAGYDAVVHVAGPFYGVSPVVLRACVDAAVPVYCDVSDPLEYIEEATAMHADAVRHNCSAVVCAGAFPGMSNVLAVEAAARVGRPRDLNFSYFTAGLGGSGVLNLEITNYGFGPPMPRIVDGKFERTPELAGSDLGRKTFPGGPKEVWAWPFPECATVGLALNASGTTVAGMGTAPGVWNFVLRVLVDIVPRAWWSTSFSVGMARFSEPLVRLTDAFLPETHAMRIDVESEQGDVATVLQAHDSFRRCVAQSSAEFCLDLLDHPRPGVRLPETLYANQADRSRIIDKLTSTPGTTAFSISR